MANMRCRAHRVQARPHAWIAASPIIAGEAQLAWDLGFLALGVLQIAIGWAAIRAGRSDETPRGGFVAQRPSAA